MLAVQEQDKAPQAPGKPVTSVLKPVTVTSKTIEVLCSTHNLPASTLAANAGLIASSIPAAGAPSQLVPTTSRAIYRIRLPATNAALPVAIAIGQDAAVSPTTGHILYPGDQLDIMQYIGPIWAVSLGAALTAYTQTL